MSEEYENYEYLRKELAETHNQLIDTQQELERTKKQLYATLAEYNETMKMVVKDQKQSAAILAVATVLTMICAVLVIFRVFVNIL